MKITDFNIKFNRDNIFRFIDCYPESPIYTEVLEEYQGMECEAYEKAHPACVLSFGEISEEIANEFVPIGTKVLFSITTIGDELSDWSRTFFEKGDYLKGMLADAFADDYLMQATESLSPVIRRLCEEKDMGIKIRLEAPTGIKMESQKVAFDITEAETLLNMHINQSYMYTPVKSTCQIYLLEEKSHEYNMEHNCRQCPNITCKIRKVEPIKVTVYYKGNTVRLKVLERQSLLEALREKNIYIPAICSGRGSCGKCRIRVLEGTIPVSESDKKVFSELELSLGWRLACTAFPTKEVTVTIEENLDDKMEILGVVKIENSRSLETNGPKMIGIDIGTTTIAMELLDIDTGKAIDDYLTINRQRNFGADVISRIEVSVQGKGEMLKTSICEDLFKGICKLTYNGKIDVEKIIIAGNTTMEHLLLGYPCNSLGVYPFTPYRMDTITKTIGGLFNKINISDELAIVPVVIMPGISTFVGADIVADILVCGMADTDKANILIDLGTNGEMAIGNNKKILVTSTAVGTAFEGGNMIHGTGSVPGAICNVRMEEDQVLVTTIQGASPIGICGSGAIEALYELLRLGYIDETGLFKEEYLEEGFLLAEQENGKQIRYFQKDIRELQLAKAAVRAGLEILLLRYGIKASEIEKVYLAGGFGYGMNIEKAVGIGLIPSEFLTKMEIIGNGSLQGTLKYGMQNKSKQYVKKIIAISEEITLSKDKEFNELYIEHMYFEK